MDIENLIETLRQHGVSCVRTYGRYCSICDEAATALSTLQAENESLKEKLYDGEGVNLVDYWMQQAKIEENGHRNCQAENEKLRNEVERQRRSADDRKHLYENAERAYMKVVAELEQVKRDKDAAIADIAAILAEVEEIRRGYGVDNADADNAFADLCRNYCAKNGNACYKEAEDYRCKNFMWRGMRED